MTTWTKTLVPRIKLNITVIKPSKRLHNLHLGEASNNRLGGDVLAVHPSTHWFVRKLTTSSKMRIIRPHFALAPQSLKPQRAGFELPPCQKTKHKLNQNCLFSTDNVRHRKKTRKNATNAPLTAALNYNGYRLLFTCMVYWTAINCSIIDFLLLHYSFPTGKKRIWTIQILYLIYSMSPTDDTKCSQGM